MKQTALVGFSPSTLLGSAPLVGLPVPPPPHPHQVPLFPLLGYLQDSNLGPGSNECPGYFGVNIAGGYMEPALSTYSTW